LSSLRVVPTRHPWRWIATVVVAVLAAQLVNGLVTNPGWDWSTFREYFFEKSIMDAPVTTLELTATGTVFGFLGGVLLAAMRLSKSPFLRAVSWIYVWVFVRSR
jgi:polar amino acid transport system permease protein